jgi:hypothetical protein
MGHGFLVVIAVNLLQSTYTGICPPTTFLVLSLIAENKNGVRLV